MRRPLKWGPRNVAVSVMRKTIPVAETIRAGISHAGGLRELPTATPRGITLHMTPRNPRTPTKDKMSGADTKYKNIDAIKYAEQHPPKLIRQPNLKESKLYARQELDSEINPINVPCAAPDAKLLPCSNAKKNRTGPEVNGRPIINPPTDAPHRRVAILTAKMKIGTLTSFNPRNAHALINMVSSQNMGIDIVGVRLPRARFLGSS